MSAANQSPAPHQALLHAVQKHQRRAFYIEAVAFALAALLLTGLAAGLAARSSPGLGRALLGLSAVMSAAVFVGWGVFRSRRAVVDELHTARWLSKRFPHLKHDWVAAVELSAALQGDAHFSATLANAFLTDFNQRLGNLDAKNLIDTRPLRRARWAFALTALLCLSLGYSHGEKWWEGITSLRGVANAANVRVNREPITGDVTLEYRYPAYTQLEPRTVNGTTGEIAAPAGTEVVFQTRADRDIEAAALELNGKRVPLTLSGARDLKGRFVLDKPGQYHVVFLDGQTAVAEGPDVPVRIETDGLPQIKLTSPEEELELDPDHKDVGLSYEVSDDFGLAGVELVFQAAAGAEQRTKLTRPEGKASTGHYAWNLSSLNLKPGQVVSYYLEATDNNDVSGPQKGQSRTQRLKVYSSVEHRREALQKAEAIWDRLVTHLADRMEGNDRTPTMTDEVAQQGIPTDMLGVTLSQETLGLAQNIYEDRDPPMELYAALLNIGDQLKRDVRTTSDVRQWFLKFKKSDFGSRLPHVVRREIDHTEKSVLYLEAMLDREKLAALKSLSEQLKEDRRELTRLLEEFKKTPDEGVQKALLEQMQNLRERMTELMNRMAELAKGIRDEHFNKEAMEEMLKEQDLGKALDDVEKLVKEGKAEEAMARMQELSMQLDEMLKDLDDASEEAQANDNPELAEKFEEFSRALDETTKAQEALSQETKELKDKYRKALRERIVQRAQQMKNELLKKTAELKKAYRALEANDLGFHAAEPLDNMRRELDNLEGAMKANDFDMAAEAAARAEESAQNLADFSEEQRRREEIYNSPAGARKETKERAEQLARDARKTHEVSEALQSLFPKPGEMLSKEDQQSLKGMSQKQRGLEQKASQLKSMMEELSQMAPVFDEDSRQSMDEAGRRMGEATRKLQSQDARGGSNEQQAALEQLKQMQQQMQQSQSGRGRGMPMAMRGGPQRGGSNKKQKVEIPDEDPNRAPRELRKDVLDAMKQGAPDRYKEQLKRYYEELVQ